MSQIDAKNRLQKVIISPQVSIMEAIPLLDTAGMGLLLLCEGDRRLVGVLTDGDIRRAILNEVSFEESSILIASRNPLVASRRVSPSEALHLMDHSRDFLVNHLPLVDADGRVVDLLLRSDLISEDQTAVSAVIMAGGSGKRLRPLTEKVPKPMLSVGGRPLMEQIIAQLRKAGIQQIAITTHYKPEKIAAHFGDGSNFGVRLNYVNEDRPLGTAGALGLMEKPNTSLLVINGDILTQMNFRAMLAYHQKHKADLTVAVRKYDLKVPYGVIESDGAFVRELVEKPSLSFFVNAGIYLLEPSVYHYVPNGQHFDMTDLIQRLLEEQRPIASFPIVEYWLDIGQPADYDQAQEDIQNGSF